MSYEAMPCVLKNEDGTPMYGLLIKPVQNQVVIQLASNQQQQQIMVPSSSCPQTSNGSNVQFVTVSQHQQLQQQHQQQQQTSSWSGNTRNGTSNRRHYPTLLPREAKIQVPTWTNNNNGGYTNFVQTTANNGGGFANLIQQQQQPTNSKSSSSSATNFSGLKLAYTNATPLSHNLSFQFSNQQTSFAQALSSHGYLSTPQPQQQQQQQQSLQQESSSQQIEHEEFVFDHNVVVQGLLENNLLGNESSSSSSASTNNNPNNNQNGNQNSTDLDSLLRDIDLSEITNSLMPLLQDGEIVNETTFLISSNGVEKNSNDNDNDNNLSDRDASMLVFDRNDETTSDVGQVLSRPPCRYQGFLSNTSNLRVGSSNSLNSNANSTMYSMFDQDLVNDDEQTASTSTGLILREEIMAAGETNDKNNETNRVVVVQTRTATNDFDRPTHEATTPDSGIQSMGDSPHAVSQSSPMQFFSSSPDSRRRRVLSPRLPTTNNAVVDCNSSTTISQSIDSQQSRMQIRTESAPLDDRSKLEHRSIDDETATTSSNMWTTKYMQPLCVNTAFFEPISECESSPTIRASETSANGSSQFGLLNTPRCYSPSTTSSDCGNEIVHRRTSLAAGLAKRKRRTKKRSTATIVAEFDDMPVLHPESNAEHGTRNRKVAESGTMRKDDFTLLPQVQQQSGKSKMDNDQLTLNVSDPNALVDKILSVVPKEQLASLRRILDERLNEQKKSQGEQDGASTSAELEETTLFENRFSKPAAALEKSNLPRWQSKTGYASDTSDVSSLIECDPRNKGKKTTEEEGDSAASSCAISSPSQIPRRASTSSSVFLQNDATKKQDPLKKLLEYRAKARVNCVKKTIAAKIHELVPAIVGLNLKEGDADDETEKERLIESLTKSYAKIRERLAVLKDAPKLVKEQRAAFNNLQNLETEASDDEEGEDDNFDNDGCVSPCPQLTAEPSEPVSKIFVDDENRSAIDIDADDDRSKSEKIVEAESCPSSSSSTISKEDELVEVKENPQRQNISVKIKLSLLRNKASDDGSKNERSRNSTSSNEKRKYVSTTATTDAENGGKGKRSRPHQALPPKKRFKEKEPIVGESNSTVEKEEKEEDKRKRRNSRNRSASGSGSKKRKSVDVDDDEQLEKKENSDQQAQASDNGTGDGASKNESTKGVVIRRCGTCKSWIRVEENFGQETTTKGALCDGCRKKNEKEKESTIEAIVEKTAKAGADSEMGKRKSSVDESGGKATSSDSIAKSANRSSKPNSVFAWKYPRKTFVKAGILHRNVGSSESPVSLPAALTVSHCRLLGAGAESDDFRLPYDIWWHHQYQKDFKCVNPSANYRKLRSNVYVDAKPATGFQHHVCSCKAPTTTAGATGGDGCGDRCLNRLMFTECGPASCPCGDRCTNNRFQKREWILDLETYKCDSEKGMGVRAKKQIGEGTFICEYLGEVVSAKTFGERMRTWYKNCNHHYALTLDAGAVIDGYRCGNIARFINHSCEPNCEMQKWWVNGQYRMGVFALRNIDQGEELSYNYKFHAFNTPQVCLCKSPSCRGFVDGGGNGGHQTRKSKPKRSNLKEDLSDATACKLHLLRPLSHRERVLVIKRRLFLLRNVDGVRKKLQTMTTNAASSTEPGTSMDDEKRKADIILSQLTALKTSRCIRTRRLAVSEDDAQFQKLTGLVQLLKSLLNILTSARGKDGKPILANVKKSVKKKQTTSSGQQQNEKTDLLDLNALERNVDWGYYTTPDAFDKDVKSLINRLKTANSNSNGESISDQDRKSVAELERLYEQGKADIVEQLRDALGYQLPPDFVAKQQPKDDRSTSATNSKNTRKEKIAAKADEKEEAAADDELYWGTKAPFVGTYETDEDVSATLWAAKGDTFDKQDDKVHCVCGICEDDGMMIQCDRCRYWQHSECVGVQGEQDSDEYACEFCTTKNLSVRKDVIMSPQPEMRLAHCVYYRALLKNGFQVRIGECVYVKKNIDERHKQLLKNFNRECVQSSPSPSCTNSLDGFDAANEESEESSSAIFDHRSVYRRSELRVFRVERLFTGPRGVKFVFGSYFARPHETFCEPSRRFYRNEIFVTPLYDTLPLDAVVGRCLVLDVQTYCKGRPKYPKYAEDDIYICEYRLDKGQRLFDKMHVRNRYPICTGAYIFEKFGEKLRVKRDFTPFTKAKRSDGGSQQKGSSSTISKLATTQSKKSKSDATIGEPPMAVDNRSAVAKGKGKRIERLIEKMKKEKR